jgi:CBS domain-containing protein
MKTLGQILEERNVTFCPNYRYVQRDQSVLAVCQHMTEHDVGAVCVFEGARLVGVFSERDVVRRVVLKGADPARVKVGNVMTTDVLVGHPDETYQSALDKMQQARVRHLPIVSGGQLIGMLSIRDLREQEEHDRDFQLQALNDYVYQVPPGT